MPVHSFTEVDGTFAFAMDFVAGRNLIFLTFAAAYAYRRDVRNLVTGVAQTDYSGYPDCRPEFLQSFEQTANLGTKEGSTGSPFKLHAPLIELSKKEIIEVGNRLGVDYSKTHSCYDPSSDGKSCGECDSCVLRKKGFQEAGIKDPITYIR